MNQEYIRQSRLLVKNIAAVFQSPHFALKGGTALNLFIQNMPRISVDIDATFLDHTMPREKALATICGELQSIRNRFLQNELELVTQKEMSYDEETKIVFKKDGIRVKIEVNHINRGTLLPVEKRQLCDAACDLFKTDVRIPCLATSEIYGGKIVAALSRQHPRDFFDVALLFSTLGLSDEIVECVVAIVAGDRKPVHEVLFSHDHDFSHAYENEFVGMTNIPLSLDDLLETRARLRDEISRKLTANQKEFLLSLVSCEPRWELMRCPHLRELPSIRWKLQNLEHLRKTNKKRFAEQREKLEAAFAEK
jgi:predicted nucleotidyltransferase component of viral defense system